MEKQFKTEKFFIAQMQKAMRALRKASKRRARLFLGGSPLLDEFEKSQQGRTWPFSPLGVKRRGKKASKATS